MRVHMGSKRPDALQRCQVRDEFGRPTRGLDLPPNCSHMHVLGAGRLST